jgi:transcriptional regulator with XRE-family HTH domain
MPRKLPHYLRSERRRSGLTQEDLAAVFDANEYTLRRYEQSGRLPPLETALAYQAAFDIPVSELFAGTYKEIQSGIRHRARRRMNSLVSGRSPSHLARRKESLETIATRS